MLVGVIEDGAKPPLLADVPQAPLAEAFQHWTFDWLILASDIHQQTMRTRIEQARREGLAPADLRIEAVPAASDEHIRARFAGLHDPQDYLDWVQIPLRILDERLGGRAGRRVLDFGCGDFYPFTLLLTEAGVNATGVDVLPLETDPSLFSVWQRDFYTQAEKLLGRPLPLDRVDVRQIDGRALPFADGEIDLVYSNAVLEHVGDLEVVLDELRRVLRPGGWGWFSVHYFACLNGFHPDEGCFYRRPLQLPDGFQPWAHLLGGDVRIQEDLNRLREADFQRAIGERFTIV
ncbi:MAG: class I SAM-dependent methyltransferase, partial [Alphaproteobacteria bacterium]